MEVKFAVGQRADQFAILADVRNQGCGLGIFQFAFRIAAHLLRPRPLLQRAEIAGEADLLVFRELLFTKQQHEVLVPFGLDFVRPLPN